LHLHNYVKWSIVCKPNFDFEKPSRRITCEAMYILIFFTIIFSIIGYTVSKALVIVGLILLVIFERLRNSELSISEKNYRLFFDECPLPILIVDDKTKKIVSVNGAAEKLYGYSKEEFLELKLSRIQPEKTLLGLEEILLDCANATKSTNHSTHFKKNGEEISVQGKLQTIVFKGSQCTLQVHNDVTLNKQVEIELKSNEARLQAILENSIVAIWALDINARVTFLNTNYRIMYFNAFGKNIEIGDNIFQHMSPERAAFFMQNFNKVLKGEKIVFESIFEASRKPYCIETSLSPIVMPDGHIVGVISNCMDITEKKESMEAIRKSEDLYSRLIESMNDGMIHCDENDIIQFANESFYKLVGYSSDEILFKPTLDLLMDEKDKRIVKEKNKLRVKGITDQYEIKIRNKSGAYIYIIVKGQPVLDDEGKFIGSFCTFTEITERKLAEEKLNAINKELDQFAYVVSHDLKAPLRAISNLSLWIEEDLEDILTSDTKQSMNLLRSRVNRMEALINGILEYSRAGQRVDKIEDVPVNVLIDEVIDMLCPDPRLKINIEKDLPIVAAEKVKLQQVFSNLLSNAIKFHDKQEGNINIGVKDIGLMYEFYVSDNGPGIEQQYHDKIFVIFQTLQPKDKVESTGVGLSIVKKIINDAGGIIRVDSKEGEGASFIFTWPKTSQLQKKNLQLAA
jgi:PAS domain S-box-containing protein